MNREKRFVFWIIASIFLVTVGFFAASYWVNKWKENHPLSMPSAQIVRLDKGNYKVGEKIKNGFYDIKVKGTVQFLSRRLSNGDQLLGIELYKNNQVIVSGSGSVSLYPAAFNKLKKNSRGEYVIVHSGFYIAGKQLPPGKYTLHCSTKKKEKKQVDILVQILPSFNENSTLSKSIKLSDTLSFVINKGNILQIDKALFDESNNVDILLTKT